MLAAAVHFDPHRASCAPMRRSEKPSTARGIGADCSTPRVRIFMLSRLTLLWSCLAVLCVACSLDSSPRTQKSSNDKADGGLWQPKGAGSNGRRINSETDEVADASAREERDAAAPAPGSSSKDGGAAQQPSTPADTSQDPSPSVPNPPTAGNVAPASTAPNAPSVPSAPNAPLAGTGGIGGDQASGAAGAAGAAGSGGASARQSLIDAALEALGNGEYPWRSGGSDGDGLSAEFVKSILFSLVASGTCFRDTRRCIQTCFVIASDCKPCAADPECADALMSVCGPIGACSP